MGFKVVTIFFFVFIFQISAFCQTDNILTKERFNYLFDSLSTEKSSLLLEKESLLKEIDSLKSFITELGTKISSSREKELVRKYGREIGNRISQGQIWKGMTERMLEDSWGKPNKIDKNKEKWGVFTQWIYGNITYFFKNGSMIDWEEKK